MCRRDRNTLVKNCILGITANEKRCEDLVSKSVGTVSYTHLDVYKRQAYQREVYKLIDAGDSVQAETLSSIMKETLQKFWSDAVSYTHLRGCRRSGK